MLRDPGRLFRFEVTWVPLLAAAEYSMSSSN